LDWTDRGAGGCGAAAAASVAHAKGADIVSAAGNDSACDGYGVPVLWSAIVDAEFAMLVPGLRSCEELATKRRNVGTSQGLNVGGTKKRSHSTVPPGNLEISDGTGVIFPS